MSPIRCCRVAAAMPEQTKASGLRGARARKTFARVVGGIVTLVVIVTAAAVFAPAWVVSVIEREAQRLLLPRLSIEGPLSWQLWPAPLLVLNQLVLRDAEGVQQLRVESLKLVFDIGTIFGTATPLDLLEVRAPEIFVSQDSDGAWNVTDWLLARTEQQGGTGLPFRRLRVSDGRIQISTPEFEFALDRITVGLEPADVPEQADITLTARLTSSGSSTLAVEMAASTRMRQAHDSIRLDDLTLGVDARLAPGQIQAKLEATDLSVEPDSWKLEGAGLELILTGAEAQGALTISGDIAGRGGVAEHRMDAWIHTGRAVLPHPRDPAEQLVLSFSGALRIDPATRSAQGQFDGGFDQSRFDLAWTWSQWPTALVTARMSIDRLTLDAYLPVAGSATAASADFALPEWQDWPVSAELRVGTLTFKGLISRDARLSINAVKRP